MKAENLINWGELSRLLCGSRFTMRKNKIPKKHRPKVQAILDAVAKVINDRGQN